MVGFVHFYSYEHTHLSPIRIFEFGSSGSCITLKGNCFSHNQAFLKKPKPKQQNHPHMCSYFGHSSLYHFPKLLICSNCEEATRLYLTCLNEAQFFGRVANWLMISREKEKNPISSSAQQEKSISQSHPQNMWICYLQGQRLQNQVLICLVFLR